jgi:hypothetical protein
MSWKLSRRQYETIRQLDSEERYERLLEAIAEHGQLFALTMGQGYLMLADAEGRECLAVWPHPDFAQEFQTAEWAGASPRAIPAEAWLERWLPGLAADKTDIAVFPLPGKAYATIAAADFLADLTAEPDAEPDGEDPDD